MSELVHSCVKVGKGTLYNKPILIVPPENNIVIGNYCAIAPNLKILGTNHDYNFPAVQYTFYNKYFNSSHPKDNSMKTYSKGQINIGNDVWIGEDVIIMSGVTIGDGCCIGARSIVTKNLEPYSICVGSPCKAIKKRYSSDMIDFLIELKWWNWSDEQIKANKDFFFTNLNTHSVKEIKQIIKLEN